MSSSAKLTSWFIVLPSSPKHLASGNPVSEQYMFIISEEINFNSSEICVKNSDLFFAETCLKILNASDASFVAF